MTGDRYSVGALHFESGGRFSADNIKDEHFARDLAAALKLSDAFLDVSLIEHTSEAVDL